MKKYFLLIVALFFLHNAVRAENVKTDSTIYLLIKRLIPGHETSFIIEQLPAEHNKEAFELAGRGNKIVLRGSNNNALAVALNHYLKYYCHSYVSWYADNPVQVPASLPKVTQFVRRTARMDKRFFLNYCTFGYTMTWWKWKDWERLIDWMALNGVNIPLAITGQESVWHKVWQGFGLSDTTIRNYFTGPAHLPWHRMANVDHWDGPLPQSWLDNQVALQKRILARERQFNMTPVLPAFSGHVPLALKVKYPNVKISSLGLWGGFPKEYSSYFLDPLDPLFRQIQEAFLKEQTKLFGTDHIYGADPFNEVTPPSWDTAYLANVSKTIYETMHAVDSSAVWLQMGWFFYNMGEKWTDDRARAYLRAVPPNKMIMLDYYCENIEIWKRTHSFFGQPFIWCYLGNFGGNTMLAGNLAEVGKRIDNALGENPNNMLGLGSTLEGFGVNPMMYNFVFEKAWSSGATDVEDWIQNWASATYGRQDENITKAWKILLHNVYNSPSPGSQACLTNARPTLKGHSNWTTMSSINYSNKDLLTAWKLLLQAKAPFANSYSYDVVNIGRQVLGNYFSVLRDSFAVAYTQRNSTLAKEYGKRMLELLDDMDELLNTHTDFLLGKWLNNAKSFGTNEAEKRYYERNARLILTTWGMKATSLNDYGNCSWAGLTKSYYKQRWNMFVTDILQAIEHRRDFDEKEFYKKVTQFEWDWTNQKDNFSDHPSGNSISIAQKLFRKYRSQI